MLAPLGGELGEEFLELAAQAKAFAERPEVRKRTQAYLEAEAAAKALREDEYCQTVVCRALNGRYGGAAQDVAREHVGPNVGRLTPRDAHHIAEEINKVRRASRED